MYRVRDTDQYGRTGEFSIGNLTVETPNIAIRNPQERLFRKAQQIVFKPEVFEKAVYINPDLLRNIRNNTFPLEARVKRSIQITERDRQIGIGLPILTSRVTSITKEDYAQIALEFNNAERLKLIVMPDLPSKKQLWMDCVQEALFVAQDNGFTSELAFSISLKNQKYDDIIEKLNYVKDLTSVLSLKYQGESSAYTLGRVLAQIKDEEEHLIHISNVLPKVSSSIQLAHPHILGARNADLIGFYHPSSGGDSTVVNPNNQTNLDQFFSEDVVRPARITPPTSPSRRDPPKEVFSSNLLGHVPRNSIRETCNCGECQRIGTTVTTISNPSHYSLTPEQFRDAILKHNIEHQLGEIGVIRNKIHQGEIIEHLKTKQLVVNNEAFLNNNYNMRINQRRLPK